MSNYPKGSEWRRWDLHVHSPASHNFTGDWPQFLKQLSKADCDVIGINDYFSVAGYRRLQEILDNPTCAAKQNLFEEEIEILRAKTFFPVVECRMSDIVMARSSGGTEPRINFHLIFDPLANIQNIEDFIKSLSVEGAAISDRYDNAEFLLHSGQVCLNDISKILKDDANLAGKYLLWLPYDEYGGIGPINPQTDPYLKKKLTKTADILGSSNADQIAFFHWKHDTFTEDQFKKWLSAKKPCIKGSDCHDANYPLGHLKDENSKPTEKYCWIKADPTFEGLKQILYEPEDRVWIGQQPPNNREPSRIITKLTTQNRPDWLNWEDEIELNPGLVCIIGNKGSGKTGLLDAIACAAGSIGGSFIENAKDILAECETQASLSWLEDNGGDEQVFLAKPENEDDEKRDQKVTYLTQQFVDELCAVEVGDRLSMSGEGDRLSAEIEKVVFEKIPEEDRLECSDFRGLRQKKLEGIRGAREELRINLGRHIKFWCDLQRELQKLPEMKARLTRLKDEWNNIEVPKAGDTNMQKVSNEIDHLTNLERRLSSEISGINSMLHELDGIRGTVENRIIQNNKFFEQISARLEPLDLSREEIAKFKLRFEDNPLEVLERKKRELENARDAKLGGQTDQTEETLGGVRNKLRDKKKDFDIDQALKQSIEEKQRLKAETETKIATQAAEIENLKRKKENLEVYKTSILDEYVALFDTYKDEEVVYGNLYDSLGARIAEENSPFDISIVRDTGLSNWIGKLHSIIDRRSSGDMVAAIKERSDELDRLWRSQNASELGQAIWMLLNEAKATSLDGLDGKFCKGQNYEDFLLAIFDLSQMIVNYSLEYNGLPLKSMSPGSKGLALMILYLQLNEHDRRPLLVDQPEENLDNQSIYNDLCRFFRDAKKRRQIIMVTHNPNLVVNTDADQVIVMQTEPSNDGTPPTLSFSSGAIENPDIRREICSILEGGVEAFKTREDRYEL